MYWRGKNCIDELVISSRFIGCHRVRCRARNITLVQAQRKCDDVKNDIVCPAQLKDIKHFAGFSFLSHGSFVQPHWRVWLLRTPISAGKGFVLPNTSYEVKNTRVLHEFGCNLGHNFLEQLPDNILDGEHANSCPRRGQMTTHARQPIGGRPGKFSRLGTERHEARPPHS